MTRDRMAGSLKQISGMMKERWGRLVADDAATRRDQRNQLVGHIPQRHGVLRDALHRQSLRHGRA
ncbi:MAG: hypothetical protein JWP20_151 [Roseomonas sp.]|jgi:uncharacterized protein YjbJ (UPF0337 family)|nr:hypothetical protein [Roseomonas sp.]